MKALALFLFASMAHASVTLNIPAQRIVISNGVLVYQTASILSCSDANIDINNRTGTIACKLGSITSTGSSVNCAGKTQDQIGTFVPLAGLPVITITFSWDVGITTGTANYYLNGFLITSLNLTGATLTNVVTLDTTGTHAAINNAAEQGLISIGMLPGGGTQTGCW